MSGTTERFSDEIAFCWATGIEDTFIPEEKPGFRALDEYTLTQHYERWEEDLALAEATGARAIRWGIPWYRVQPTPDTWDWEWADRVIERLVAKHRIIPIIDLMHYGTPQWLDNSFINVDYPQRVAEYMGRAAERYAPLTHYFTPHNEPVVNAEWCGQRGEWPPYLVGEDGFFKVLLPVARGMALGSEAIRAADPKAVLLQVEAKWHFTTREPALMEYTKRLNGSSAFAWDLSTGKVNADYELLSWMQRWGVTDSDLAWFEANATRYDMVGVNFYPWSWGEHFLRPDGTIGVNSPEADGMTLAPILREAWERHHLPMMITETSALLDVDGRSKWLDETVNAVRTVRAEGLPVVGYTWFPMMTMFDWLYRRGEKPLADYAIHLGLYDSHFDGAGNFVRKHTPLVDQYARLAQSVP